MRRKIAVFTGNRAEFGLLLPVIQEIAASDKLELQLLVAGAHLDPNFGRTIDVIHDNQLDIAAEIAIDLADDDLYSTALAIGDGIQGVASALQKLRPDMLLVYADRFEGFSAVIAAAQMRIPVGHIEGGDVTEGGALDDSVRHAMTKLSHLHFTTNHAASLNVKQLGEEPWRVFNVGLPSIDAIVQGKLAAEHEIETRWPVDLSRPIVVFTQHSVTTQFDKAEEQILASLGALTRLLENGVQLFLTYPNNDAGGKRIIQALTDFASQHTKDVYLTPSMGSYYYHGMLALARDPQRRVACVGNSSSGIKETPIFGCPTVNIGSRQDGRLRAENLIDVGYDKQAILAAVQTCLFDDAFRQRCFSAHNPYGDGTAARQIVDVLCSVALDNALIAKKTLFTATQQT
ncbi:UDP-N-acetylglucosamine 2-epimerase [Alteromonas sp. CYL-A6]|uniref:UDP-N-acetylglucosamine 2-epimerase n=1 Tax=Alteromonas nitratireducens TaxID=3390813 RepID=UPI0034B3C525